MAVTTSLQPRRCYALEFFRIEYVKLMCFGHRSKSLPECCISDDVYPRSSLCMSSARRASFRPIIIAVTSVGVICFNSLARSSTFQIVAIRSWFSSAGLIVLGPRTVD